MKEKSFIRWLGSTDRSRQLVVFGGGKIVQFTVQYETFVAGKWRPVVRYDTALGFAHKDLLSPTGETEKKIVASFSYNDAFTNAELDIKLNWQRYKDEYLRKIKDQKMDAQEIFGKNVTLSTEFNKYLIEHPEFAEQIPDEAVVVLLPADNPELCQENLRLVEAQKSIDDVPNRPVVYVKIERLAPPPVMSGVWWKEEKGVIIQGS